MVFQFDNGFANVRSGFVRETVQVNITDFVIGHTVVRYTRKLYFFAYCLITEYATKAGRKVYDGGGITPDVKIEPKEFARITQELVLRDICFDFVNSYAIKNPAIAPIQNFVITDDIYNQFINYLKEKNFSYETESQQILEKLIKTAKAEKFYDMAKSQLDSLQQDFTHSIDRDMQIFKDEITSFLAEQFMQRYYYMEGVIEYKVSRDPEVKKAIEILTDSENYKKILSNR